MASSESADLSAQLLAWYDREGRVLPWRAPPGAVADPYRVWLSEIMLQQTTVAAVKPYHEAFLDRWPTVEALAAAELDDVLHAWQGLGYYARARNLHACARVIADEHGGRFPDTAEALRKLPGVGRYTSAAVAAIAFGRTATPVDGNVERVMARLHAIRTPLPDAKPELTARAETLTPSTRPGDYAQAVMDLGATICLPRGPRCMLCPWRDACSARRLGVEASLPARRPKAPKSTRRGVAFWIVRPDGAVLLRRRAPKGLLGGMMEIPSTEWLEREWNPKTARAQAPLAARWRDLPGLVRHTFSHFHLELTVTAGLVAQYTPGLSRSSGAVWVLPGRLGEHALPSVMKKVVHHALRKL